MENVFALRWLEGLTPSAVFLTILWALLEPKISRRSARWALAGFLTAETAIQGAVYVFGNSRELVFTLLPLTLYLPAILGAHLLSRYPPLSTAAGWLFALLCQELVLTTRKLLFSLGSGLRGPVWPWVVGAVLLLAAAGLVAVVLRFFRKPFHASAEEMGKDWTPLLFLATMLLALYSYLLADPSSAIELILLFFTALAAALVTVRLTSSLTAQRQVRDSLLQMEALRRDYALLQKKLDLGRRYRHDARHHMLTLSALLRQGDVDAALDYVSDWQGQLTQTETRSWCKNAVVNAVLRAYQTQAEEAGCVLEARVSLPEELPFEETDLCVALANALENAVHASQAMPRGASRHIELELALTDHRRLTLHMKNPCPAPVEFDGDGFPVTRRGEGHGQGLRSIAAVAEKYHGMFWCGCEDGLFDLRLVLLDAVPEPHRVRRIPAVRAGVILVLFLLNCMPALAQTLETVPVLGRVIQVVDLRSYSRFWGGTGISVEEPVLDGDRPAADEAKAKQEEIIQQMRENFLEYAARKYQGYVAEDVTYEVMRDDETLFILRFNATINAGGSMDCRRHIVLDKGTEQVLSLADLFKSDVNYIFLISREIKAQMEEQMNAGEGDYFLPGGIWSEEECFKSIDEDQDFYIDEAGQLVIVFDEYEVAPGSMGVPEFTIPTDLLDGLLAQPTPLQ